MEIYLHSPQFGEENLMPLLAGAALTNGDVCLQITPIYGRIIDKKSDKRDRIEAAFNISFGDHDQFSLHRGERVKSHYAKADATLIRQVNGGYHLCFNLGKLLCLPCVDIGTELKEVHEMLLWLREEILKRPHYDVTMMVANNRDNNKRVYAETVVQVWPEGNRDNSEAIQEESEPLDRAMKTRIQSSQALSHLMREIALSLGRMGPWSKATITEQAIFGENNGPHWNYRYAKLMERRRAELAASPVNGLPGVAD